MIERISVSGLILSLVIVLASASAYDLTAGSRSPGQRFDAPVEALPLQLGSWSGTDVEGLGIRPLDVLRLDRYVRRMYRDDKGRSVILYIGYWTKQTGEYQAAKHSPSICLPANGWAIERLAREKVGISGEEELSINRLVGRLGRRRMLFYYWFFTGNTSFPEEWQALLRISFETFFRGRSDGGIVEITTEVGQVAEGKTEGEGANDTLRDFTSVLVPALHRLTEQR